jgi:hypothetical protein
MLADQLLHCPIPKRTMAGFSAHVRITSLLVFNDKDHTTDFFVSLHRNELYGRVEGISQDAYHRYGCRVHFEYIWFEYGGNSSIVR